jgi:hypothetical protein
MQNPSTSLRRCLFDNNGEALPALDEFLEYLAERIAAQRIAEIQGAVMPPETNCGVEPSEVGLVRDPSPKLSEEESQQRLKPTLIGGSPRTSPLAKCSRKGKRITF